MLIREILAPRTTPEHSMVSLYRDALNYVPLFLSAPVPRESFSQLPSFGLFISFADLANLLEESWETASRLPKERSRGSQRGDAPRRLVEGIGKGNSSWLGNSSSYKVVGGCWSCRMSRATLPISNTTASVERVRRMTRVYIVRSTRLYATTLASSCLVFEWSMNLHGQRGRPRPLF